jgi:beta-galactosidase
MAEFPDLDSFDFSRNLDFASWDSYPTGYAEKASENFYLPDDRRPPYAHDVGDPYVTGFCHDLTRGMKSGLPFWVMEQQAGGINWSDHNTGVNPGAVKLWTWHALARGADAVVYFRWRACRYGFEQYHSGLLNHDGSPDIGYHEISKLVDEKHLMSKVASEPVGSQVAILLDYQDLWAMQLQPHRKDFNYVRHLFRYCRALSSLGVPIDIVSSNADLQQYEIVIAPTLFMVNNEITTWLSEYVKNGGTLVLGVRSGFKDSNNLVTEVSLPGELRKLVGARINKWHALPPGIGYEIDSPILGLNGSATFWAEYLEVERAQVLVRYKTGPFEGNPALTENTFGNGKVYYIGWYPEQTQAKFIMERICMSAGVPMVKGLPECVLVIPRGEYRVWLNFRSDAICLSVDGIEIEIPGRSVFVGQVEEK